MGIDINAARFIVSVARGGAFERTLTVGRQGLFVEKPALAQLLASFDSRIPGELAGRVLDQSDGFCEPFLRALGATEIESLDVSAYQGCSIVHDLNEPVPASLHKAFSTVIDSGTLEHIFNLPQAIRNCMEMVRVGGRFICITTANNFMGHGFFQFSPELFFRVLSPANGFVVEQMLLCEEYWDDVRFYDVPDPVLVKRRVTLINRHPTYVLVHARRTDDVPIFAQTPQQSDYVQLWQTHGRGERRADAGRLTVAAERTRRLLDAAWRAMRPAVPESVRRRLRLYRRGPNAFDPELYNEVTL